MKKSIIPALIAGLSLLLSGSTFAAPATEGKFEFINKTKEAVSLAIGTHASPPEEELLKSLAAGATISDTFKYSDTVQLLLKMTNGDLFTYEFDNVKPGKNIKLKLTTGTFNKKIELEAQFATSNIGKKDIFMTERHLKGKEAENFERPTKETSKKPAEKEPAKKPSADKDADKTDDEDATDNDEEKEEAEEPVKKTVTPFQILKVNEKGDAEDKETKILGLKFKSLLKDARDIGHISLEWDSIRNAQTQITKSYQSQKAVWDTAKGVGKQAKSTLDALKVPADEQEELAKEVEELIESTYKSVKKTFSKIPGASDESDSDSDDE